MINIKGTFLDDLDVIGRTKSQIKQKLIQMQINYEISIPMMMASIQWIDSLQDCELCDDYDQCTQNLFYEFSDPLKTKIPGRDIEDSCFTLSLKCFEEV
jgi:hypothetical protein